MNNSSRSCKLGKARKRRRKEGTTGTDRLSHLPEHIVCDILSLLDTKSAVRTSVLSRVWRCAWKHVPVLDLDTHSFSNYSTFQSCVDKVLFLRYNLNVRNMRYIDSAKEQDVSMCVEVIKYALSHDAEHLVIDLNNLDTSVEEGYRFSDLFGGTISSCTLQTLELSCVYIDRGFGSSGFGMLSTLKLEFCRLDSGPDEDLFSGFPSLKNLVLIHCNYYSWSERIRKISGPQLRSLELDNLLCSKIEIVAPRLKIFTLRPGFNFLRFFKLRCPSLDHAHIHVEEDEFMDEKKDCIARSFISLFQDLNSAISLTLDSYTIQVLSDISEILEQQPSPFTRLRSLFVEADNVPYVLVNYFLKGSSSMKPNMEFV